MADAVRQKIVDAARGLFLHYGYKRTTVEGIAAVAGVSKGSVYLHFQSKEEIFGTVSEQFCSEVLGRMEATAAAEMGVEDKIHKMFLDALLAVWDLRTQAPDSVELWAEVLAAAEGHAESSYAAGQRIIARVIAEGQATGVFDPALDPAQTAWLLQVALQGFESPYVLIRQRQQVCESLPKLLKLLVRGMRNCRQAPDRQPESPRGT